MGKLRTRPWNWVCDGSKKRISLLVESAPAAITVKIDDQPKKTRAVYWRGFESVKP
jgi:hypothetical protein